MEQFDPAKARRVWQRVQEVPRSGGGDLRPLMQTVQELAGAYQRLGAQVSGPGKGLVGELAWGAQEEFSMLAGVQHLQGGPPLKGKPLPGNREGAVRILEKCYYQTRRLTAEYAARSLDPEYGMVFHTLADRARGNCAKIAQAIGELGK